MGVALRLKESGIIKNHQFKQLMKIYHARRKNILKVANLFPAKKENSLEHWDNILTDPGKDSYVNFQILILKALVLEKISYEKASGFLSFLDTKSTQELAVRWQQKIGNEINH